MANPIAMKKLLLTLTAVTFVPALASAQVVEEIIARVNDQIVTKSEIARSKDQLRDEAKQQDANNADKLYADKEKDVLRDLIDQQLLLEKGKDLGITADTELIKKLDEMRKQMNLDSMEELEKAAASQGISYEDFKQNLRNQIITQQVIGREVGSHLNITKEEEQKFYEQHKSEMEQPEQIRLSEILVSTTSKTPANPPAEKKSTDILSNPADAAKSNANVPLATSPVPVVPEADQLAAAEA